jgi:3-oxoacyl-[acyl-carrier-protein] synthase-3
MNLHFQGKRITGIVSVVPKNCVRFEDEIGNYGLSRQKCMQLQKVMGFNERRIVENQDCASDLVHYGLQYLIESGGISRDEIRALVFVSQTPDHFMPPTSCILHGKLGLGRDVLCFDINHGCTGYIYGLIQSFMLLDALKEGKVVLMNADTLSRRACRFDRNIYPIIGDAGAITVIENSADGTEIMCSLETDGSRSHWLMIPAGGFRMPSDEQTRQIKVFRDGNRRSDDDFFMNGSGIFTFTQTDVPASIKKLFGDGEIDPEKIDYFLFHQPNRFLLENLARKLHLQMDRVPANIVEKFGNPSSASIPLTICHNARRRILEEKLRICMAGFGVGLSWGTLVMEVGPLSTCELLER